MTRQRVHRLTRAQMDLLARAAEFVLAGEWPWTEADQEAAILESAAYNLRAKLQNLQEHTRKTHKKYAREATR